MRRRQKSGRNQSYKILFIGERSLSFPMFCFNREASSKWQENCEQTNPDSSPETVH